jgi:hypothetical protein
MRFKLYKQVVFHLIIIFIASLGLWATRTWPYEAALFPKTVTTVVLIVTLLSLFTECYKRIKKGEPVKEQVIKPDFGKNTLVNIIWLAAYIIGIWLLGYFIASVLYVFLYMKIKGKLSWLVSTLVSVGIFAFLAVVFVVFLEIKIFPGVLWNWLGL